MNTVFDRIYIKWYYTATQPKSKIYIKTKLMACYVVCTITYIYYTSVLCSERINVREYRRGIKMDGKPRETDNIGYTRRRQTNHKHSTICAGHHYTQSNANNVNKTLLWGYKIGKYFSIVGLNTIVCSNLCACVCKAIIIVHLVWKVVAIQIKIYFFNVSVKIAFNTSNPIYISIKTLLLLFVLIFHIFNCSQYYM